MALSTNYLIHFIRFPEPLQRRAPKRRLIRALLCRHLLTRELRRIRPLRGMLDRDRADVAISIHVEHSARPGRGSRRPAICGRTRCGPSRADSSSAVPERGLSDGSARPAEWNSRIGASMARWIHSKRIIARSGRIRRASKSRVVFMAPSHSVQPRRRRRPAPPSRPAALLRDRDPAGRHSRRRPA